VSGSARSLPESAHESPFDVPPVSSGYPLEEREQEAIDRVLDNGPREPDEASGDQEAA
jgi:hypothetical protein